MEKIIDKITYYSILKNLAILAFAFLLSIPLNLGFVSIIISPENLKEYFNVYIAIVGIAVAFAVLLINYSREFLHSEGEKEKEVIRNIIDGLIISSLFPTFTLLFILSKLSFGRFDKFAGTTLAILVLLSFVIFSFCILKLWCLIIKKFTIRLFNL